MPETKKQADMRRQRQRHEREAMVQHDTYLIPPKKEENLIERFISQYPQYKDKVSETLVKQVLTGELNPEEFNELKGKFNLLSKDITTIKKYKGTLKPNRFKRKTQKIFLR
jgi:hypothetical protein